MPLFLSQGGPSVSEGCRETHTQTRTEGGQQKRRRMRAAERDRMSHKGTNTVRGSEISGVCVCPQGQGEGPVSISLSFFN